MYMACFLNIVDHFEFAFNELKNEQKRGIENEWESSLGNDHSREE